MKPGSASEKEYLLNQLNAIEKTLKKQFGETYKQAINIGEIRNVINSGDSFSFSNNPSAKKKVDSMLKTLQGNLTNTVSQYSQTIGRVATQTAKDGVKASVNPSKKEQDFVDKLSDDAMKDARKSASESAGEAKMSSSVWNFGDYSKEEIQAIINAGIRKGLTVQGIADSVTPYLNNPLLEDAEPEFQKIQTPKGVYKSAYKNALRLARTEVMRAYDEAEWNSYQNDPMVVGFEVKTSNNHTVLIHGKRVPLKDMCDQLAGKYPKSFKFTGWHPQCRCTMLPITIGTDELGDLMEAQENGEEFVSKNTVTELPENFNQWYDANKDRFNTNNEPWFLSENKELIEGEDAGLVELKTLPEFIESSLSSKMLAKWNEKIDSETKENILGYLDSIKALGSDNETLKTTFGQLLSKPALAGNVSKNQFTEYLNNFGINKDTVTKFVEGLTKFDFTKAKEISTEYILKIVDKIESVFKPTMNTIIQKALNKNFETRDVKELNNKDESDEDLIKRVGGPDKTKGSCASVALAYMANKIGYSVEDFRGGECLEFFADETWNIAEAIGTIVEEQGGKNLFYKTMNLLDEDGSPAIFGMGKHASVVRKKEGGGYQFLELQDEDDINYWHSLDYYNVIGKHTRFHAEEKPDKKQKALLIKLSDIEKNKDSYVKLMKFINTAPNKQQKGKGGSAK